MRFELTHELPVPPDRAWNGLFGDAYQKLNAARAKLHQEILEERRSGPHRFKRTRVMTQREIPPPFAKILGNGPLSYELEENFEDSRQFMRWRVIPGKLGDKVTAEGTYSIVAGASTHTSIRKISGEVRVSIPFVGEKLEKLISKELEAGYERSTAFAREWLRDNA